MQFISKFSPFKHKAITQPHRLLLPWVNSYPLSPGLRVSFPPDHPASSLAAMHSLLPTQKPEGSSKTFTWWTWGHTFWKFRYLLFLVFCKTGSAVVCLWTCHQGRLCGRPWAPARVTLKVRVTALHTLDSSFMSWSTLFLTSSEVMSSITYLPCDESLSLTHTYAYIWNLFTDGNSFIYPKTNFF